MPFNFPNSPTVGQQVTNTSSSIIYQWNGTAWTTSPLTASQAVTASFALNAENANKVVIGDAAPALVDYPTGSLWFNSQNLGLYINYQDADTGQWVGVNTIGPVATASFAQTASFVATASNARTASYVVNTTVAYAIPDTLSTAQWVLLGTWSTGQNGQTLRMNISAHSGYNAQNTQLQATDVYIATSNGISTSSLAVGGAFYATGLASVNPGLGTSTFAPSLVRLVQVSVNSYQVYAYFGTFSANSHYTVSVSPGTTWTNSGTLPGITPGGTYLDIIPGGAPMFLQAYSNALYVLPGSYTADPCRYNIVDITQNIPAAWFNTSTYRFTPQKAGYWEITACYDIYRGNTAETGITIRKNGVDAAVAGAFGGINLIITKVIYMNGTTDFIQVVNTGNNTQNRQQDPARSYFQARWISE